MLRVDFQPLGFATGSVDPVLRGSRVYDRKNHTYVFTMDLKAFWTIYELPFESLPEPARRYITIRAARLYNQRHFGENAIQQYTERDEMKARQQLNRHCGVESQRSLKQSFSIYDITENRNHAT